MDAYRALYQISKTLNADSDPDAMIRALLDQIVEYSGASKGFIVVREHGSFQEKYRVRYDPDALPPDQRRFSRSLVRQAIRSGELFLSEDISLEARFAEEKSVMALGKTAVAVAPLRRRDEVNAVVYLERSPDAGPFSEEAVFLIREFLDLAGVSIHRELERQGLRRFKQAHQHDLLASHDFAGIVARDPAMTALLRTVVQAARANATVLVRGETGTGKDLIARAVHRNSDRAEGPFVAIHCGALPETLFEAELFGHTRGAFTGAAQARQGRIAQAAGGTLFIDEVAEIPLAAQAKLLRFFQSGEFQRIGSDKVEKVDARIVAATHRDLEAMIEAGEFRQDLYYRLNVVALEIPPLRQRRGDIPVLIDHFLKKFGQRDKRAFRLTPDALNALERYDYPGNVRELMHLLERVCVLAQDAEIGRDLLPKNLVSQPGSSTLAAAPVSEFQSFHKRELKRVREEAVNLAVENVERQFLEGLLARSGGNVSEAARSAGLQRTYLHRLIAKYR